MQSARTAARLVLSRCARCDPAPVSVQAKRSHRDWRQPDALEAAPSAGFKAFTARKSRAKKTQNGPARGHKKGRSGLAAARARRVCHGSDQPPRGGRKTIKRNAPALYKTEHLPMLARCMTCAYHLPPPHGPGGGRELKNMLARNGGSRPVSAASVPTGQSTQGVLFLKDANASFRKTLLYRMENVTKLWIRFPRLYAVLCGT